MFSQKKMVLLLLHRAAATQKIKRADLEFEGQGFDAWYIQSAVWRAEPQIVLSVWQECMKVLYECMRKWVTAALSG